MTEIFEPKIIALKERKFWQKYSLITVLSLMTLLLVICGYLIYHYYYLTDYDLNQFLPENYLLSVELKTDPFNLPKMQLAQLLTNPIFNQLYQSIRTDLDDYLINLPADSRQLLSQFQESLFFLTTADSFGFIAKIPNEKLTKQLRPANFPGFYTKIIDNRLFLLSNSQELFSILNNKNVAVKAKPYFSLSLSPWLKINLPKSFFTENYNTPILNTFKQIAWPLSLIADNYTLEITSQFKQLQFKLYPATKLITKASNQITLADWLKYLPENYNLLIGFADLKNFTENLQKNQNMQDIFKDLDAYLWQTYQLSLSNLIKQITGPVIFSQDHDNWQIITALANKQLAESYLKQYFGQFKPKNQQIKLPDGTLATELINNPESIAFDTFEKDGWKFNIIKDNSYKIGYKYKENALIIGTNLENSLSPSKQLDCQGSNISNIFSLKPEIISNQLSSYLLSFSQITAFQTNQNQIDVCLNLK